MHDQGAEVFVVVYDQDFMHGFFLSEFPVFFRTEDFFILFGIISYQALLLQPDFLSADFMIAFDKQ